MRIRLADYVADFLVSHGVTDVFSVVGGGAMHLNDALGHNEGLKVTYNHHEQACAMAAESYARIDNRIAAVCVTTGPGGTNACPPGERRKRLRNCSGPSPHPR